MQNINGFVSVPVSFAGLQTIDQQTAGRDPLPFRLYSPFQPVPVSQAPVPFPFPSAAFTARSLHSCRACTRSCFIFTVDSYCFK